MKKKILITGGMGFIGANSCAFFINKEWDVISLDNLSRKPTTTENSKWLGIEYPKIRFVYCDIRHDTDILQKKINEVDVIIHLAAQTSVVDSITNPQEDYDINVIGTKNVVECAKNSPKKPLIIFSSSNKVYGKLDNEKETNESQSLNPDTPYAKTKKEAEDIIIASGLKYVIFRQSCIYGPRQFGNDGQGWVSWILQQIKNGQTVNIYGDGNQKRDLLYVDDLLNAYNLAIESANNQIYNIGGGIKNVMSVLELVNKYQGNYVLKDWRLNDQKCYISDLTKIKNDLGWEPQISIEEGLKKI